MKYFEENKVYNYEEIKKILDEAQAHLMSDLSNMQDKELDDLDMKLILTLHVTSVVVNYKALLLKGNSSNE